MKQFLIRNKIRLVLILILTITCGMSIVTYTIVKLDKQDEKIIDNKNIEEHEPVINKIEEEIIFRDVIQVEINTSLPNIRDYVENNVHNKELDKSKVSYYFNGEEINPDISKIDTYDVVIKYKDKEYNSQLKIVDTTKPDVEFKSIAIYENTKYDINNFISSYKDNSGSDKYTATYVNESTANLKNVGTYSIILLVCDESKNCVEETVKLVINKKNSNNNTGNGNNGNNDHGENGNNDNENKEPSYTSETKREITNSISYNYGVKKITYYDITYKVSSDGTKTEVSRTSQQTSMDYSGFNGTIHDMTPEAESIVKKNTSTVTTILNKTNELRVGVGVSPLVYNEKLSVLATIKAMEMAYSNKFDHKRPDGSEWSTLHDSFYNLNGMPKPSKKGENLAAGYGSDSSVVDGWRESSGHYSNMIDSEFKNVGIGKYSFNGKTYWVQIFAS